MSNTSNSVEEKTTDFTAACMVSLVLESVEDYRTQVRSISDKF